MIKRGEPIRLPLPVCEQTDNYHSDGATKDSTTDAALVSQVRKYDELK